MAAALWITMVSLALSGATPTAVAATPGIITRYVGEIDEHDALPFLARLAQSGDRVVGLKLRIQIGSKESFARARYIADDDGDRFVLGQSDPKTFDGFELVTPASEAGIDHGAWVVDGFYLVKVGSVHQQQLGVGLKAVDEGAVRLNPAWRIVDRPPPR